MKRSLLLSAILFFFFTGFSQNKKIEKIEKLFQDGKYDKCITKAKEYNLKDKSEAATYYFIFLSFLKEYEVYKDHFSVKMAAKNLNKGLKKDGSKNFEDKYKVEIVELHRLLKEYAHNYYEAQKEKSKPFYEYLAKIYNDTLDQYDEIVLHKKERPDAAIIDLIEKGELNYTDDNGLKQGKWTKVYSNGLTAYEVFFIDNKPVGDYKRYHENGKLSSLLKYDEKGENATAQFFDVYEKKISEGNYIGVQKSGSWIYYKNDIKIKEEEYKNGKLTGSQITYFESGEVYDLKKFENGIQIGIWAKFHPNGKPHMKAFMVNGVMEGSIIRYYSSGLTEVKGHYKSDLKEGIWTFYGEEGNKDTIEYKKGVDVNEANNEKRTSEEYKKNIEKGKTIIDPAHYKNNPSEYPKK